MGPTDLTLIRYDQRDRVVHLTLDRPERMNAIVDPMLQELRRAVEFADADPAVHVIVLAGAGTGFCSGYDLTEYAERPGPNPGSQEMPWDPTVDLRLMGGYTQDIMAIWRARVPVIAKVHGAAIGGGSDIALTCDQIVMADDARIGYPPARVWGIPTTMMWVYRIGIERAKRLLFTGDVIDGVEAARLGLVSESVPSEDLDDAVDALAARIASVPRSQLALSKTVVNQAYESMGLSTTQLVATLFDGIARHSPDGVAFKRRAEEVGWRQAVAERDQ
jgi:enoyl-CoA hydratase